MQSVYNPDPSHYTSNKRCSVITVDEDEILGLRYVVLAICHWPAGTLTRHLLGSSSLLRQEDPTKG